MKLGFSGPKTWIPMTEKGQVIKIYDDASTLKVLRMYKGKKKSCVYMLMLIQVLIL
jgi:hypothetical protein